MMQPGDVFEQTLKRRLDRAFVLDADAAVVLERLIELLDRFVRRL